MKSPSRIFVGAFMGSLNQPGFSLTLLNLTHVSKTASSVDQVTSLIDAPHASAAWPANNIIGSTPEALRKRTREEKWIDVPEETAEVAVRRGAIFLMLWSILLITFVVEPDG
jgi:dihydroxyacetone kinase